MITKRKLGRGKVRVTFSMPPLDDVQQLHLVGDFNDWSDSDIPLKRDAKGGWSTAVSLDTGREYQFRYLANGIPQLHNEPRRATCEADRLGTPVRSRYSKACASTGTPSPSSPAASASPCARRASRARNTQSIFPAVRCRATPSAG